MQILIVLCAKFNVCGIEQKIIKNNAVAYAEHMADKKGIKNAYNNCLFSQSLLSLIVGGRHLAIKS